MPEFRNPGTTEIASEMVSDELVARAGRAIAEIREVFRERSETATSEDERQQLSHRADQAAAAAVQEHGLSIEQYDQVLAAADENTDVEEKLMAAALQSG